MARRTRVIPSDSSALICFSVICVFGGHILIEETRMSRPTNESQRLLSHIIAEWACALKYEDLSPETIQAAKLFWFDSIGCALGGSQQEDARILLKHYRAIGGNGKATAFVSGFNTNPVDAAFLNGHMILAVDYNDIYWKADPCHPSDLIAAPLALCESEGLSGKDLILATIIAYDIEMRLCEIGRPGVREYGWHHATLSAFAAPIAAGRVLNLTRDQLVSAIGISAARTFCPGAVTAGKLTNMKNTVDPWAGRMGAESALLAREGFTRLADVALSDSRLRDEEFSDRSAQSRTAHCHDENGQRQQDQG